MKINRELLLRQYMDVINRMCDEDEDKSRFYPVEIIDIISSLVFPVSTIDQVKLLHIYTSWVHLNTVDLTIEIIVDSICDIIEERWGQL